ncbi:MAG: sterol desaturase family protein, partial [Fulvivirga sp.]
LFRKKEEEKPTYGITKPINSWNPVWVNFDHYYQMLKQLKEINGFKNKIKFLFYKPGWLPKELGGYQSAPEVDKSNYKKFDTPVNSILSYYVLFQYIMILGATALFLFNYTKLELPYQIATVLGIILTIVNAGALLERKSWAKRSEIIRVLLVVGVAAYAIIFFNFSYLFLIPVVVYFLISMLAMPYSTKLAV